MNFIDGLIFWFFLFIIFLLWSISSLYYKSYQVPRVYSNLEALKPTFFAWLSFSLLYFFTANIYLLPIRSLNPHVLFILTVGIFLHLISIIRYWFFHQYRLSGKNTRNVLLIGPILNIERLKKDSLHYGYRIQHVIDDVNNIGDGLNIILIEQKIDLVFLRDLGDNVSKEISNICDQYGVRLKLLLDMNASVGKKAGLDIMGDFPVMDVRKEPLLYLGNRFVKRIADIIMSSLSIIFVLSWLPIIIKIAQILFYPGPLFFVQKRIGRNGRVFKLFKFRTMFHSIDSKQAREGESEKTVLGDTRVPWFGKLLRKTNLDEYPQFLNVFMGSMSTVGPRPHMVGEDQNLVEKVINYKVRQFIKPGITGWAAINGYRGGTEDLDLMSKRTQKDIWYLENWSIWLDIKIMAITFSQMVTFRIPKAY